MILANLVTDYFPGAVWRIVIDDQDVCVRQFFNDLLDKRPDVFALIVGRCKDQNVPMLHGHPLRHTTASSQASALVAP
jgi:hypothetical protein